MAQLEPAFAPVAARATRGYRSRRARSVGYRLALSVAALIVGSILIFSMTAALPGGTAEAVLGKSATPDALAAFKHRHHLDQPLPIRYAVWIGGAAHGDLGESISAAAPVWRLVRPRLVNSLMLAAFAMMLTIPAAVGLGVLSGLRAGASLDTSISAFALVVLSLPEFVLGILLAIIFGKLWPVLPPTSPFSPDESAFQHLRQVVLPASAAGGVVAGYVIRMTRASTIEVLDSDFIAAARLRGVSEPALIARHLVRNALVPVINVIGSNIAWMFGGLVVIETVFAYPGIGSLLVNATETHDAPLVAGIALIIMCGYIGVNLAADLLVAALDPRLRVKGR